MNITSIGIDLAKNVFQVHGVDAPRIRAFPAVTFIGALGHVRRNAHRIMKILGFSAQKPLDQAWKQDATLVRAWDAEIYPAIRA